MRSLLRHVFAAGLVALLTGGALGCTAYPATPADPAYDTDVLPIFEAHCIRCHGAGGNLNIASYPGIPDGGLATRVTTVPYLTQYGDTGCPSGGADANPPQPCAQEGALTWASLIGMDIHKTTVKRMPLPPAPTLNSWELQVLDTWLAEQPMPLCSHSTNPDPALHCAPMSP